MRGAATARRWLRRLGIAALALVALIAAAFGALQTAVGRDWLVAAVVGAASGPGRTIAVEGVEGFLPFDLRIRHIAVADAGGMWLSVRNATIELSPGRLLGGTARIGALTADSIEVARLPQPIASPEPTPSVPLSEMLRLPRLPLAIELDRLAIERVTVAPSIAGEAVTASVAGSAALHDDTAQAALELRRIDGSPGSLAFRLALAGTPAVLTLRLTADEPTGALLGRLLDRGDRPPLSLSLTGEGPVAAWRGHLEAVAGSLARFDADIAVAAQRDATVDLSGVAAIDRLLTPELASLVGARMPIALRAIVKKAGGIAIERLSIEAATAAVTGDALLGTPDRAISAHLRVSLPRLAALPALGGGTMQGVADIVATLSGTEDRPRLDIDATGSDFALAAFGAEHAEAHLRVSSTGDLRDPSGRIDIAARGELRRIAVPDPALRAAMPDRDLAWSLAARATPDGGAIELTELAARGAGLDLTGNGVFDRAKRVLDGHVQLAIADLRPLGAVVGRPVEGAVTFAADAQQQSAGVIAVKLDGSIARLRSGIPAFDALSGGTVTIAAAGRQDAAGTVVVDRLSLAGAGVGVAGTGSFDPAHDRLVATLDAEIARLQPLGAAIGTPLGGRLLLHLAADGPLARPRLQARLSATDLISGATHIERLRLDAALPDPAQPQLSLTGEFRGGGIEGTLAFDADARNPGEIALTGLRLKAADSVVEGDLRIDRTRLLARGALRARAGDLSRWSRLAGQPLAGSLDIKIGLDAQAGQSLDLTLAADRLAVGAGASRAAIAHVSATARLKDLLGTPSGTAQAAIAGVALPSGTLSNATIKIDGTRPGRFAFTADAQGRFIEPLTVSLGGDSEMAPHGGGIEIRIARLNGALGTDRFGLTRTLRLTQRGADLALADLALNFGGGQVTGNGARRGGALSLQLAARNLSVASAGRLAGYKDVAGTVTLDVAAGGTLAAPQGRFTLAARNLRLALPKQQRLPTLGIDLGGTWNGREMTLNGRVSGLQGEAIDLGGSLPLALTPAGNITVPPHGRLALRLQGSGELANLADLLPLGEDRVTGRFALDAAINGTVAAPSAGGRLTITDGRYENFATGAVLSRLQVDIAGDRDRVTLRSFSAADAAGGTLTAQGGLVLAGAAPSIDMRATLQRFRVAARNDTVVTASGTASVAGAVASPKVTAQLTVDQGDIAIPDTLPPSVARLKVVEIHSRAPIAPASRKPEAAKKAEAPVLPATLDIEIGVPGRVFVRGRGLDSEWRGRLKIAGTSAAPQIVGALGIQRGTFDFLGKTFRITTGRLTLDGSARLDPVLDIVAEVVSGDVTAQVLVRGPVSAPTIALTSNPVMPQDEILARVLFNRSVGQITAAEGIQVAQAAAALAGGGPGVLDRLRGRLGLDRLVFGSAPAGSASSNLNPAAGGSATASGSAALSGGKYVTEGVYVGATQGLTPQSSKVTVEIEVRPHVTVQTDVSQAGGTGIGLNYKYDY